MSEDSKTQLRGAVTQIDAGTATTTYERVATAGDPYELGEVLGRGGMGEVVLARDLRIGRDVAIKRMLGADPEGALAARFLREARIQARLDHPAIVPVHEVGADADGRPFFVMKRLAGTTLHDVLHDPRAPRQPMNRLLRVLAEVCLAIDLAHARRVVHRDLKPSNIMLGGYGEVYVLDWGVARELDEAGEARPSITPIPGATQIGTLLGTPGYAAPEQLRGDAVGVAADVYSLGSILFEVLTGDSRAAVVLLASNVALVVVTTLLSNKVAKQRRHAQQRLAIQAWHLSHLLPAT